MQRPIENSYRIGEPWHWTPRGVTAGPWGNWDQWEGQGQKIWDGNNRLWLETGYRGTGVSSRTGVRDRLTGHRAEVDSRLHPLLLANRNARGLPAWGSLPPRRGHT